MAQDRDRTLDDREAALNQREAALAAREAALDARMEAAVDILAAADQRDVEAADRDTEADARESKRDKAAFVASGESSYGDDWPERRSAVVGREHAKGDREASHDDRIALTEDGDDQKSTQMR